MAAFHPDMDVPEAAGPADRDTTPFSVGYQIDDHDRIVAVTDTWADFAVANDASHLCEGILERSLWEFIGDSRTRELYQALLARVRAGQPARFPFRCDAPAVRRFMRMTMTPTHAGGVRFDSVLLRAEPRTPQWSLSVLPGKHATMLTACGWCNRIAVADAWEEIEVAVERLGLFGDTASTSLTHGICPACVTGFFGRLQAAD